MKTIRKMISMLLVFVIVSNLSCIIRNQVPKCNSKCEFFPLKYFQSIKLTLWDELLTLWKSLF